MPTVPPLCQSSPTDFTSHWILVLTGNANKAILLQNIIKLLHENGFCNKTIISLLTVYIQYYNYNPNFWKKTHRVEFKTTMYINWCLQLRGAHYLGSFKSVAINTLFTSYTAWIINCAMQHRALDSNSWGIGFGSTIHYYLVFFNR